MKLYVKTLGLIFVGSIFVPLSSHAQSDENKSPYAYSGKCTINGSWTQAALKHSNEIKQVLVALKENPACKGLTSSMESSLNAMEQNIGQVGGANEQAQGKARTLMQLPGEIAALRSFSRENSAFKSNVMDLLLGKTVLMSALSSRDANGAHKSPEQVVDSLGSLAYRSQAAASAGLSYLNSTMNAFEQAKEGCLDDSPLQGALIAGGIVKVLNTFATSNSGIGQQVGNSVAKFAAYLGREKKYIDGLRALNDAEFLTSMSCLVEVTTEGYCNALDAHYLLDEVTKSSSIKLQSYTDKKTGKVEQRVIGMNENFDKRMAKGPLAGYYILTREVPVVTEWLQKVQYGITPQLPTEAQFQIEISNNVMRHNDILKNIQGKFNMDRDALKKEPDYKTRQSQALDIVLTVAQSMTETNGKNFFTQSMTHAEIYFGLLGMNVPQSVLNPGINAESPDTYLRNRLRSDTTFADPEKTIDLVEKNMRLLFKKSTDSAMAYYKQYFHVDVPQIAGDSLLGLNSNVRDALVNIDQYLENFQQRFSTHRGDIKDPSIYPLVIDTRRRIGRVLARYKEHIDYGRKVVAMAEGDPGFVKISHQELDLKLQEISGDLLKEVYDQFQVLTARTGLLSNRMAGVVFQDYTATLKNRDQFSAQFEDLMLSSGYTALNSMVDLAQSDLSKIKVDLAAALKLYKTDLAVLEPIVSGVFVRNIFKNKIALTNEDLSADDKTRLAYEWSKKMAAAQLPNEQSNGAQRWIREKAHRIWLDLTLKDSDYFDITLTDKLVLPFRSVWLKLVGRKGKIVSSATSSFDSDETILTYICAQSLAFQNLGPYWALCQDAKLNSPLLNESVRDPEIRKIMQGYLAVPFVAKAYEHIEPGKKGLTGKDRGRNYEARICAVRDYHRRNKIAHITASTREDGDTYQNPFLKSTADEIKAAEIKVAEQRAAAIEAEQAKKKAAAAPAAESEEGSEEAVAPRARRLR